MKHISKSRSSLLEGGFQEETAKDHEVVAVAVLRLHYLDGLDLRGGHVDSV
jgi:hypothetical protein